MRLIFRFLAFYLVIACGMAGAADGELRILALGDSLTAGYGLGPGEGFPMRLEAALKARGHAVKIIDAGVSGDTTRGGLARLDWSLGEGADAVIVELGGNDALRGLAPKHTRAALDEILGKLKSRNIPVLLAGMMAPPNLGPDYGAEFNRLYSELAKKHDILLYPFFLDGVAARPELNQGDGIHPTAAGIDVIVGRILPSVEALVEQAQSK